MLYLKIENPGVAPAESFTLLGASTKDPNDQHVIGKFGSGGKHSVVVLMRHNLSPTIFCGNLRMEFQTREQVIDDGLRKKAHKRVVCQYGGKDANGTQKSATEDLGLVLQYGAEDWTNIAFGLREFVSNAIDRAIDEGRLNYLQQYANQHPGVSQAELEETLRAYDKTATDYNNVVIEMVQENQVRAKAGTTRVFVPVNEEVFKFYDNLGKWFLHFSEPESLGKAILSKNNRNLNPERKVAVVYRRGVRVREFESGNIPSLFDYNLDHLELDESRKVDDYYIRHYAAVALAQASQNTLRTFLASFYSGDRHWEHEFDSYPLVNAAMNEVEWKAASGAVLGDNVVLAAKEATGAIEVAKRKGYEVLIVPDNIVQAAAKRGVPTVNSVLSVDDLLNREIIEPNDLAILAVDKMWAKLESINYTSAKEKPAVKMFRSIMQGGMSCGGFYRDNTVFLREDKCTEGINLDLEKIVLEEIGHYISGAMDGARDFQDWAFGAAVRFAAK